MPELVPDFSKLSPREEALTKKLKESASKPMTKAEKREQRISWVYGNLPFRSKLSREDVARMIDEKEGV